MKKRRFLAVEKALRETEIGHETRSLITTTAGKGATGVLRYTSHIQSPIIGRTMVGSNRKVSPREY